MGEIVKEKEESFPNSLVPGRWNKVDCIISPAKQDQIQHLKIGLMNTNNIQFPPPLLVRPTK